MDRLLSPLCGGGDSARCGTWASVLQRDAGGLRMGPHSRGLRPAEPAAGPRPRQPQTVPWEGTGRRPRNGPGKRLPGGGDVGVPPPFSLFSVTSTYPPRRDWPRPARSPAAPPSVSAVGWGAPPAGPRFSVLPGPVRSSRFAGACDSSTSFTRASLSLSKHMKPSNKSNGSRHNS